MTRVAIACQGGGSHTAFTAGALAGLFRQMAERDDEVFEIVGLSGTSGGALCAAAAWNAAFVAHDWRTGKAAAADAVATALKRLWLENSAQLPIEWWMTETQSALAALFGELPGSPQSLAMQIAVIAARTLTRPEFSDLGALITYAMGIDWARLDGLSVAARQARVRSLEAQRHELARRLPVFAGALSRTPLHWPREPHGEVPGNKDLRQLPRLLIGAVDVSSGRFQAFDSCHGELSRQALQASACLPTLFAPVAAQRGMAGEAPGRDNDAVFWDGLFSQNPPIRQFLSHHADAEGYGVKPDEIWLIQINPQRSGDIPTSAERIADRRNELTGNLSMNQEVNTVMSVNWRVLDAKAAPDHGLIRVHRLALDESAPEAGVLGELGPASKLRRDQAFISGLLQAGEAQAERFLAARAKLAADVAGAFPQLPEGARLCAHLLDFQGERETVALEWLAQVGGVAPDRNVALERQFDRGPQGRYAGPGRYVFVMK